MVTSNSASTTLEKYTPQQRHDSFQYEDCKYEWCHCGDGGDIYDCGDGDSGIGSMDIEYW